MFARELFRCKRCNKVTTQSEYRDISARFLHGSVCFCSCENPPACWIICLCCRERSPYYSRAYYVLNEKWYGQHFASRPHTESHVAFLEQLRSFSRTPFNRTNNISAHELVHNCYNLLDPSDQSLVNSEVSAEDEEVFNVLSNLLPPNFKTASFLTPEMIKYHQNEHKHPGYGMALSLTEDVSDMTSEEVQFHIDACRLCIEITRSKVSVFGSILHEIITYFTCVPRSGVHSSESQNDYIDLVSTELQEKLPNLAIYDLMVIQKVLGDSFLDFAAKPAGTKDSSPRGLFYATRPPQNESELNQFYLDGPNSIYENLPCQKATKPVTFL